MTSGLKEQSKIAKMRSSDAYNWTAKDKLDMVKEMVQEYIWKILALQRIHILRNSFLDGPIKNGKIVWALTNFGRKQKETVIGKVLTVGFVSTPIYGVGKRMHYLYIDATHRGIQSILCKDRHPKR